MLTIVNRSAPTITKILSDHEKEFWSLQLLGWSALSITAFFVGPIWYGFQNFWLDILVIIAQSLVGVGITLPLRILFRNNWGKHISLRIGVSIIAVIAASIVWTFLKMEIYANVMPRGHDLSIGGDFGGWLYVSLLVMGGWTTFYYGIKFFREVEIERKQVTEANQIANLAQTNELRAQSLARDAQLLMLRYQINPHFLFNTLNTVSALVGMKRGDEAQSMLIRLSEFFRHTLESDPYSLVPLEKEIEAINHYLEVEKSRFGDKLKVEMNIRGNANSALVPSMILQPIFENSIKYAISENENGGTLRFDAKIQNSNLILSLTDDGAVSHNQHNKSTGIGLKNLSERLNTHFEGNFELISGPTKAGGFEVKIRIPFRK